MNTTLRTLGCTAALATAIAPVSAGVPEFKYEFNLSDFGGKLPLMTPRVKVDAASGEIFALEGTTLRVFTASGMQTFSFELDPDAGRLIDLAVDPGGDLFLTVLTGKGLILRQLDYRGREKAVVTPLLPDTLAGFVPDAMSLGPDGHLHLLSGADYRIVVLRVDGGFVRSLDLAPLLGIKPEERGRLGIGGFGFDGKGNLLVTIQERFQAYVIGTNGAVREFGTAGSAPGRFGVVGAITGDRDGNIYVADKQRSVVLCFNADLEFVAEFGGYGDQPENLIRPTAVQLASNDRVLVGQLANRGVSIFRIVRSSEPSQPGQEVDGQP